MNKAWWDNNMETLKYIFINWVGDQTAKSRQYLVNYILQKNPKSVVDFGCGLAIEHNMLREKGYKGEYLGLDITDGFLERCREAGVNVKKADLELTELPDQYAELVWARHILEHQDHYAPVLQEMCRVAEKEVVVIFFLPPHDEPDRYELDPNLNREVNVNTYNKKGLEDFGSKYGKVTWVDCARNEVAMHIDLTIKPEEKLEGRPLEQTYKTRRVADQPRVGVALTVRASQPSIGPVRECLESLENQTYSNYFVSIIDDGSTEEAKKDLYGGTRLSKLGWKKYQNVYTSRGKFGRTRATAISKVLMDNTVKYLLVMDSDDKLPPEYINHMVELIESTKMDFIVPTIKTFGESEEVIPTHSYSYDQLKAGKQMPAFVFGKREVFEVVEFDGNVIGNTNSMDKFMLRLLHKDFKYIVCDDMFYLQRIHYHQHTKQQTQQQKDQDRQELERILYGYKPIKINPYYESKQYIMKIRDSSL